MVQVGGPRQRCLHTRHLDIISLHRHLLLHTHQELLDHRRTGRHLHGRGNCDSHLRNHQLCRGLPYYLNTNTFGHGRELAQSHTQGRTLLTDPSSTCVCVSAWLSPRYSVWG